MNSGAHIPEEALGVEVEVEMRGLQPLLLLSLSGRHMGCEEPLVVAVILSSILVLNRWIETFT
jgi:hypothetical protein